MDQSLQVRCPRCSDRLCDRTPSGLAAGHFRCHKCKLEVVLAYTPLTEVILVAMPVGSQVPSPSLRRRLPDGRLLVPWGEVAGV